ncbi:MAG: DUF4438 family protein [Planctomycetota bacterium]|jgi:hypothetical protein
MIKTNQDQLVEVSVCGRIAHPVIPGWPNLCVSYEGKPFVPVGIGGIAYNVKVGDPAFGWAWGDHVEPGVSIRNPDPAANGGLMTLACIGNEASVVRADMEVKDAKLKGASGVVVGKHGCAGNVMIHFPKRVVEKLVIGDKIQVRSAGVGVRFLDHEEIMVMNCAPNLLRAINPSEKGGRVRIMVAKLIPGNILGAGVGGSNPFAGDLDIQGVSAEAVKEYSLDMLRLGDLVAISDLDCSNGPRWQREAVTIGAVVHGASWMAGHGPGVNVLFTSPQGAIEPIITRKANVLEMLKLT